MNGFSEVENKFLTKVKVDEISETTCQGKLNFQKQSKHSVDCKCDIIDGPNCMYQKIFLQSF